VLDHLLHLDQSRRDRLALGVEHLMQLQTAIGLGRYGAVALAASQAEMLVLVVVTHDLQEIVERFEIGGESCNLRGQPFLCGFAGRRFFLRRARLSAPY
jgi:hypothetical protein